MGAFVRPHRYQNLTELAIDIRPEAAHNSKASCDCGYVISSPQTPRHYWLYYSDILETDFLHLYNITNNQCWSVQGYNITVGKARGQYGKLASPANIVLNPLINNETWSGQGIHGGSAGVQLWVRSAVRNDMVPIGEIVSRAEMAYGSYRVGMKVTSVPGTCTGIFWVRVLRHDRLAFI